MILENQKAIVTGGGDGIGRGIALRLAEEGADIAVVDINAQSAEKASEEVRKKGRKSLPLVLDVSNHKDVKKAVDTVLREWGQIDIFDNWRYRPRNFIAAAALSLFPYIREPRKRRILGIPLFAL